MTLFHGGTLKRPTYLPTYPKPSPLVHASVCSQGCQPGAVVTKHNAEAGLRVVRGLHWKWDDQVGTPIKSRICHQQSAGYCPKASEWAPTCSALALAPHWHAAHPARTLRRSQTEPTLTELQDGGRDKAGTLLGPDPSREGWWRVAWDHDDTKLDCRVGFDMTFDLAVASNQVRSCRGLRATLKQRSN